MPARTRTIFTTHARTKITLLVYKRLRWIGHRAGIPLRFEVAPPTLSGNSIRWSAKLYPNAGEFAWEHGEASTVAEAMDAIEREAAKC